MRRSMKSSHTDWPAASSSINGLVIALPVILVWSGGAS
jgi:hypothetical protein